MGSGGLFCPNGEPMETDFLSSFPFYLLYNPKFRQPDCSACHLLSRWFLFSSTLNMEVTCSSETSIDFQRTTRVISFRNIEFSDSIHRPGIKKQTKGNTTFRKLDLFPSLGAGKILFCWVP
jgi:hypothetical protein